MPFKGENLSLPKDGDVSSSGDRVVADGDGPESDQERKEKLWREMLLQFPSLRTYLQQLRTSDISKAKKGDGTFTSMKGYKFRLGEGFNPDDVRRNAEYFKMDEATDYISAIFKDDPSVIECWRELVDIIETEEKRRVQREKEEKSRRMHDVAAEFLREHADVDLRPDYDGEGLWRKGGMSHVVRFKDMTEDKLRDFLKEESEMQPLREKWQSKLLAMKNILSRIRVEDKLVTSSDERSITFKEKAYALNEVDMQALETEVSAYLEELDKKYEREWESLQKNGRVDIQMKVREYGGDAGGPFARAFRQTYHSGDTGENLNYSIDRTYTIGGQEISDQAYHYLKTKFYLLDAPAGCYRDGRTAEIKDQLVPIEEDAAVVISGNYGSNNNPSYQNREIIIEPGMQKPAYPKNEKISWHGERLDGSVKWETIQEVLSQWDHPYLRALRALKPNCTFRELTEVYYHLIAQKIWEEDPGQLMAFGESTKPLQRESGDSDQQTIEFVRFLEEHNEVVDLNSVLNLANAHADHPATDEMAKKLAPRQSLFAVGERMMTEAIVKEEYPDTASIPSKAERVPLLNLIGQPLVDDNVRMMTKDNYLERFLRPVLNLCRKVDHWRELRLCDYGALSDGHHTPPINRYLLNHEPSLSPLQYFLRLQKEISISEEKLLGDCQSVIAEKDTFAEYRIPFTDVVYTPDDFRKFITEKTDAAKNYLVAYKQVLRDILNEEKGYIASWEKEQAEYNETWNYLDKLLKNRYNDLYSKLHDLGRYAPRNLPLIQEIYSEYRKRSA